MLCIILRLIDIKYSDPSHSAKVRRSEYCMMDETALRQILMEEIALRECGRLWTPSQSLEINTYLYKVFIFSSNTSIVTI